MPFARCKWYDDEGAPRNGGCRNIGFSCEFVHPSEPRWNEAPPPRTRDQNAPPRDRGGSWSTGGPPAGAPTGPRGGAARTKDAGWNTSNTTGHSWGQSRQAAPAAASSHSAGLGGWGNSESSGQGASAGGRGASSGGWGDSTGGWGAGSGGWDDTSGGGSGTSAPVQVPAVARSLPKPNSLPRAEANNTGGTWGTTESSADEAGATRNAGDTWGANVDNGWASIASASGANSIVARDKSKQPLSIMTSSVLHSSTATQDHQEMSNPFAPMLDSPAAVRRPSYAFDDPTFSPSEDTLPTANTELDELIPDAQNLTWKSLVKNINKAVQYQQELAEANIMRDKVKRLFKSRRMQDASDDARAPLEKSYGEYRRQADKADKRLKDVLDTLAKHPLDLCSASSINVEVLQEYVREAKAWMATMDEQMQDLRRWLTEHEVPGHQPPSQAEPDKPKLSERLVKMESRVDDLRIFLEELDRTVPASVQKAIDEEVARCQAALDEHTENVTVALTLSMGERYDQVKGEIRNALSRLGELRKDVRSLQERDHQWWQEAYKLKAEHEDLSLRLTKLEHARFDQAAVHTANTRAIQDLDAAFKRITLGQSAAAAPPPYTEELCDRLSVLLRPAYEQEVMTAVSAVRESALVHAHKQEELLYSRMFEQLQPSLRVLATFNEFIETHRACSVDASPGITHGIQQAMS
ncbi:hypothetical protein EVJ58_g10460 [Rhodofomes roseus]|uniref:C3H1-type domain-containing protein n=1 Tax=Rhodofomes roseus TaxID=34475 RepID=A0A4Y9XNF8_9APHY|nr:hypothetical protein EVJ58_g10460 [Rhodofomes roseus]